MFSLKNKKNNSKKILVIVAVFLCIVGLLAGGLLFARSTRNRTITTNMPDTQQGEEILNLDPPTEEDKQVVDETKARIVSQDEAPVNNNPNVTVTITDATQYDNIIEVRGFANIVEEGATCTVTLEKGTNVIRKKVSAFADATVTGCSVAEIARSEFAEGGTWKVTLSYTSTARSGTATSSVEVK